MSSSINLITAQISFLSPRIALIHVPIQCYSFFLQPVLRLLFGDDHDEDAAKIPWTNRHDFLNISITPVECSVICSRELAERFFSPLADLFNRLTANGSGNGNGKPGKAKQTGRIEISTEDYIVIQVEGQGLDAGQRVLELTSPLAMAGISIFFLTTYFSDYILVPARARRTVSATLEQRGFVFSQSADAFVSQLSPSSPTLQSHTRQQSSTSSTNLDAPPPTTPPAKDVSELQRRTFAKLKRSDVKPMVDQSLKLLSCAGSKEFDPERDKRLKDDLLQVLLGTCPAAGAVLSSASTTTELPQSAGLGLDIPEPECSLPNFSTRFLSLTLTSSEPISVLLESSLLKTLGNSLLGAKEDQDILIPITLDLRELPMESTGIVCGVAGRLAQGTAAQIRSQNGDGQGSEEPSPRTRAGEYLAEGDRMDAIEISFLSTARAGTVIVNASELDRAVRALEEATEVA